MISKRFFIFVVCLLAMSLASCTGNPGTGVSNGTATRGKNPIEPLPRLIDNSPGENHFDTLIQLTDGGVNRGPVFQDNGRKVGFTSLRPPNTKFQNYAMFVDASGLELVSEETAKPVRDATPAQLGKEIRCFTAIAGTSGQELYSGVFPHPIGEVTEVLISIDGGEPKVVSSEGQKAGEPTLTPDGRYVVYSGESGEGEYDLFVHDLEFGTNEKITTTSGFDGDPAFSKDGRRLLFVSQRNDKDPEEYNLFVADWLLIQEE